MYEDMKTLFSGDYEQGFTHAGYTHAKKVDNSHGRMEIRECRAISDEEYLDFLSEGGRWKGLSLNEGCLIKQRSRPAITFQVSPWKPNLFSKPNVVIGALKIATIGSWISLFRKIEVGFARTMPPKTLRFCVIWRLTCSNKKKQLRQVFKLNV